MATRRPTAPRTPRRGAGGAGRGPEPRPARPAARPAGARSSRPASSRPSPAARGRSTASLSAAERRRTRGPRALVLVALVVVLAVFLLPSLQKWLEQRSEIGRLDARIAQQQSDLAAARAEQQRWADPDHVRTQARARLGYVLPGEKAYVVDGGSDADQLAPAQAAASLPQSSAAWYADVWDSLRLAGLPDPTAATAKPVPAPSTQDGP
ncbi:FtsB family cell division protein [Kineococcus rubinsiae]|uniref:FtsB family cell division protein n=1 Tax=Kineococcus rubinsiae TaxID=2609562 RepID=UPI0014314B73|nr:septum formation initiator family protein [Kineococcus rubinsiae]NIZ93287.1 septum formation initiator family protein [Kineococcus rubinsiae]